MTTLEPHPFNAGFSWPSDLASGHALSDDQAATFAKDGLGTIASGSKGDLSNLKSVSA